jgi:hypothetical protein
MSFRYFEETPERIIAIFQQWEYGASRSPNERVSRGAPLDPPTVEEARGLIARLHEIKAELATRKTDRHRRPVGESVQAAWGLPLGGVVQ